MPWLDGTTTPRVGSNLEARLHDYYNVTEFSISTSSASDQSTALATMYAALPSGATIFFPQGTYVGLHTPGKSITILGAGRRLTEFRAPGSVASSSKLIDFGTYTNCSLIDVHINAQGNTNLCRGVSVFDGGSVTDKWLLVDRCRFSNFTSTTGPAPHDHGAAGVYVFTANQVVVTRSEFVDCRYPIYMDTPGPQTEVTHNHIWSTTRTNCSQGIVFRQYSGTAEGSRYVGGLIGLNTVENVGFDYSGDGVDGNCIQVEYCEAVRVIGNTCRDAEAAGIHIAAHSAACVVEGNIVSTCGIDTAGGITIELFVGEFTTIGTSGVYTGCAVTGNTVFSNSKYGIQITWSAGTTCIGNVIHDNGWEAIQCDSDRCVIAENVCFNNFALNTAPDPTSAPNVQSAIRVTTGTRCVISDNQIYDSLTTPVCDYSIAVNDSKHVVTGNVCYQGFTTAAIFQTGSSTNQVANNIIT